MTPMIMQNWEHRAVTGVAELANDSHRSTLCAGLPPQQVADHLSRYHYERTSTMSTFSFSSSSALAILTVFIILYSARAASPGSGGTAAAAAAPLRRSARTAARRPSPSQSSLPSRAPTALGSHGPSSSSSARALNAVRIRFDLFSHFSRLFPRPARSFPLSATSSIASARASDRRAPSAVRAILLFRPAALDRFPSPPSIFSIRLQRGADHSSPRLISPVHHIA